MKIRPYNINQIQIEILNGQKQTIKQKCIELLQASTAHGLPNMVRTKNSLIVLMWSICFLIATGLCSYITIQSLIDYLKFDTVTSINEISENKSQFPTVSFCAYPNSLASLDDTFLSVKFNKIKMENFSRFFEEFNDTVYGKCFRFNSGKNIYGEKFDIINSTTSGKPNNLKIELFLESFSDHDFAELLIYIHNHSSPPYDMDDGGYWIKPGSWNYYQGIYSND